jgi:hypothetical protein
MRLPQECFLVASDVSKKFRFSLSSEAYVLLNFLLDISITRFKWMIGLWGNSSDIIS